MIKAVACTDKCHVRSFLLTYLLTYS